MSLPLAGIRVLDLSRILAGPSCTQTLGDLGAEVIKIERPGEGDDTRKWGPPFVSDAEGEPSYSAYFSAVNRNKKSLTVDISSVSGRNIVRDLISKCDILVENFKTGDLARRGLGWADARAINPALIYCSITGFGQTGPYSGRLGYDFMIQGMSGLMSVTGEPGGEPMKVGVPIADILAGLYASTGILAALHRRDETGLGTYLDIALLDCVLAVLYNQGANYLVGGAEPARFGNGHPNIAPYQSFETADGHINLGVGNDAQFRRLCAALGMGWMADDPKYKTNSARLTHRLNFISAMVPVMRTKSSAEWLRIFEEVAVPCGPINTVPEVLADPQIAARGMLARAMSRGGTGHLMVASPLRAGDPLASECQAAPKLGEHTDEVLKNLLDLDDGELVNLHAAGVI